MRQSSESAEPSRFLRVVEYPTAAVRPPHSVLNNGKASAITGPIRHWEQALGQYLKEKGHTG